MNKDGKTESIKATIDNPLVFISHDTRDSEIAEEFSNLLKRVSAGVLKSFRSSDKKGNQGIEYGVEWYPQIIKNIQNASDVVCLLTANSLDRPWILFEAGMAKGKLNTSILGVSLGVSLKRVSTGPFAQFQNCGDDEDSLCKLVFQLVDRIPNSEPDNETIRFHVQKFKSKIDEISKKNHKEPKTTQIETADDNSSVKLFEEIKVMFQDLPSRIERDVEFEYPTRKRQKFHPMMIHELMHTIEDPKIGILIGLSLYKNKMPWIYDYGIETLRIIEGRSAQKTKMESLRSFERMIEYSTGHPFMREYLSESKDDFSLFREIPRIISRGLHRMIEK